MKHLRVLLGLYKACGSFRLSVEQCNCWGKAKSACL